MINNLQFSDLGARTCFTSRHFLYSYVDAIPQQNTKYTAILLHGHGDFSFGWRFVVPFLVARGIRCIVPDLLGFGETSKPVDKEAYRLKAMAGDIIDVLQDTGVADDEQVVVVGHDWGSQLASRLVLHYPERFKACVSLSAPYIPPPPVRLTLDEFVHLRPNFAYWRFFTSAECPLLIRDNLPLFWNAVIRAGHEEKVPMAALELMLRSGASGERSQQRPKLWDQTTYEKYTIAYARGGWEAPMNWYKVFEYNFEDELSFVADPTIELPFLTVLGSQDPAVPVEAAKESESLLVRGEVAVLQCGHWMPQEAAPELVELILEWIDRSVF